MKPAAALVLLTALHSLAPAAEGRSRKKPAKAAGGRTDPGASLVKGFSRDANRGNKQNSYTWAQWAAEEWTEFDDATEASRKKYSHFDCTIPRRSARTLTEEEFHSDYYLKKPVIIEHASDHWRSSAFSNEELSEKWGHIDVKALQKIGSSFTHMCPGVVPVMTSLAGYMEGMTLPAKQQPPGGMPDEPWYVFDHQMLNHKKSTPLRDEIILPPALDGDAIDMILSVGPVNAGTQFHKHSDGFSILTKGFKRWWTTSGENVPQPTFPADNVPIRLYADELFPNLSTHDRPQTCVQGPGELMYVPEGWCEFRATTPFCSLCFLNVSDRRITSQITPLRTSKRPSVSPAKIWSEGR